MSSCHLFHSVKTRDGGGDDQSRVKHAGYADDLGGARILESLRIWWDRVIHYGPLLGYYPKATKSWLVVKINKLKLAAALADANINVTSDRRAYPGGFIGTAASRECYARQLVMKWCDQLMMPSKIGRGTSSVRSICIRI